MTKLYAAIAILLLLAGWVDAMTDEFAHTAPCEQKRGWECVK